MPDTVFCNDCGGSISVGSHYCSNCGIRIGEVVVPSADRRHLPQHMLEKIGTQFSGLGVSAAVAGLGVLAWQCLAYLNLGYWTAIDLGDVAHWLVVWLGYRPANASDTNELLGWIAAAPASLAGLMAGIVATIAGVFCQIEGWHRRRP